MLKWLSKRVIERYFEHDDFRRLEELDRKLRGIYTAPLPGGLIRKYLGARVESSLRSGDYKRLKAYNMVLNRIETETGLTELRSMPVIAHFNLTSKCNLRCIMCFQAHNEDMERLHMPPEILAKLSETLFPFLKTVKMDASGEALLYPEFNTILNSCDEYGIDLQLTTNGTLLTEEMTHSLLAFKGLRHFCVSFDAVTREVFETIRVNARFEKVYRNFEYFCRKRRELGRDDVTVGIAFTALRQNIEHLPALVELAHDWGIDIIYVAYVFISGTSDPGWSLYYSQDLANRVFDEALQRSARLGVGLHLPPRFGQTETQTWRRCTWAWNSVYLHPNGIVGPCCIIQYFTQTDDGRHLTDRKENSLVGKSFKEIWNGESYRRLRESVNSPEPVYFHCKDSCPVFGRGEAADLHRHFDPVLYPDEEALKVHRGR